MWRASRSLEGDEEMNVTVDDNRNETEKNTAELFTDRR